MVRIDYLIFGYRRFIVDKSHVGACAELFLKKGISVKFRDGEFVFPEKKAKDIKKLLDGKIPYRISEPLGLYGLCKKMRFRYGFTAAILFFLIIYVLASSVVWDIRIEGSEIGAEEQIKEELEAAGLSVGKFWRNIDKSSVENSVLLNSKYISWLNINRRGTVAYVNVIDKHSYDEPHPPKGYANVVATRDCIIEEISVKEGYPMVEVGETVKAGQVLISGVIPMEHGGGYCYASGSVMGRFSEKIEVCVPRSETILQAEGKTLSSVSLNFFGFSIKLLKIYRNLDESCAIILDERGMRDFKGNTLPLGVAREYVINYTETELCYADEEMLALAIERMEAALSAALSDKTLLKIKSDGGFNGESYVLSSSIVCSSDVCETAEFEACGN